VTRLALLHATGISLPLFSGVTLPPTPLLLLLATGAFLLWRRPGLALAGLLILIAGALSGSAAVRADLRDCRLHLPREWTGTVTGRYLTRPLPGRSLPFRIEEGLPVVGGSPCRGVLRMTVPGDGAPVRAGERIRVRARWEGRAFSAPGRGEWAGRLRSFGAPEAVPGGDIPGRMLALRGRVQERIGLLWGDEAPVVEALVMARREHLDPDFRQAFALSGTAHLLAISGFHVGVVAGLLLGLLRLSGVDRRRAALGAAVGCWIYVLGIGAPHAAVRAAVLLTLLAGSRIRGWPVVPVGALGTALLALLVVEPRALASVGFQLSFAGTAGILLLREPVGRGLAAGWRALTGRPFPRGRSRDPGHRILRGSADGLSAGIAATLPTLPLLAWHFDRISLVGIPLTLLVAPGVSAAIPGIGASLLLSLLGEAPGRFLAGGTGLVLKGVEWMVRRGAEMPGASIWVSREALLASLGTALTVHAFLRRGFPGRVGPPVRRGAMVGVSAAVLILLPALPGRAGLEVHMLDVGQGASVALRFPGGSWVLVDAGPRGPGYDAGARQVAPYLRRHGVRRLEALVITHPHLDHFGGVEAVMDHVRVRGILDPSRPAGSGPWLRIMERASREGTWWWQAEEGRAFRKDGVEVRVLHPDPHALTDPGVTDPNDWSVVLLIRWGEATVLLTGDAPAAVERRILYELPPLTVLKTGHHGSRTSTSRELLVHTRPRLALIPVGDGNRFGHPHREVTDRLDQEGIETFRTDRDGHIRVRISRDGSVRVRTGR
jgi:competence protein ComEC